MEHRRPSQRIRGQPGTSPSDYDEVQRLFDYLDDRVDRVARSGRKGAFAALRDAQMIKTAYAFGLRRNELCRLELADLRPNPHVPEWGTYGSVHVRYGKAVKGGVPRRRTVLAVPEFDWAIDGLRQWVEQARPLLVPGDHPALWLTERLHRISLKHLDKRFCLAARRGRSGPGTDVALPAPFLRDPPDRVRLPRTLRPRAGRSRLRVDHGDLRLGEQRLQAPDPAGRAGPGLLHPRPHRRLRKMIDEAARLVMRWNLRQVMAARGLFQTSDLVPLLADTRHPHEPPVRAPAGDQSTPAGQHRPARRPVRRLGLRARLTCSSPSSRTSEQAETGIGEGAPAGIGDLRPVRAKIRRPPGGG